MGYKGLFRPKSKSKSSCMASRPTKSNSYLHGVDCVGIRAGGLLNGEDVAVAALADLVQDLERAFSVLEAVGTRTGDLHAGEGAVTHGLVLILHRSCVEE